MKNSNTVKFMVLQPFLVLIIILLTGCEDFVKIDPPRTDLIRTTVFESDDTADAAMIDIYYQMQSIGFASGSPQSITSYASFSSDETISYNVSSQAFNQNELAADNSGVLNIWSQMYNCIYKANAVLEGVAMSQKISPELKIQLLGEAKFVRAFCLFYLVNLFGDVPLITTTAYRKNAEQPRTSTAEVYAQIISDLTDAKNLLPVDYAFADNARVRANRGAAAALLARAYLFTEDWTNAEVEASEVIDNTSLYALEPDLSLVFRTTSKEAIFQLWTDAEFPKDRATFFISSSGPRNGALRPEFVATFDPADQRWIKWGQRRTVSGTTYFGVLKYLDFSVPPLDYSTVMRVVEQYLIRAEARTKLDKRVGANSAESDVNIIRNRAGLPNTSAITQSELLQAIENERRWELFGEWGHRWLDLKRTGRADAALAPVKGSNWDPTDILYPIPEAQILNNPAMRNAQNPGY